MALKLKDKQSIVSEIKEITKGALSVVIVDFRGIKVDNLTELRKVGRKTNVYIRVVRNTLLCRAIEGTVFECLKEAFIGPTIIACAMKHPGSAIRLFKEFIKKNIIFQIKAVAYEGKLIQADQIDFLATLPTYEEAISRLMLIIKEAAIGRLIRILIAIRNKKETI